MEFESDLRLRRAVSRDTAQVGGVLTLLETAEWALDVFRGNVEPLGRAGFLLWLGICLLRFLRLGTVSLT